MKTDDGMTLNVNHGFVDGTQGANKKVKAFTRCLKIKYFHWLLNINRVLNWRILIKTENEYVIIGKAES
jgi:hypothetical protein